MQQNRRLDRLQNVEDDVGVATRPATTPDELWHELFRAEFARVVAVCRSLGADDPEDVAQEAFARTYHHRDRIGAGAPNAATCT